MAAPIDTERVSNRKVTISLPAKDINPPVFIAGSFTEEPWLAEELELSKDAGDTAVFSKTFQISPGEYHYKFRLGPGNWWICDERNTIIKDELGNSNNLLIVPPITDGTSINLEVSHTPPPEDLDTSHAENKPSQLPPPIKIDTEAENEESPLMKHESFLGTWEPNQEDSPMHRRASTSLGIRISRIGTFLPPESTTVDGKSEDTERFPHEREDILARIERLKHELPEDDSAHVEVISDEEIEDLDQIKASSVTTNESHQKGIVSEHLQVCNLDGISEVDSIKPMITTTTIMPATEFNKISSLGRSYGTISADPTVNAGAESPNMVAFQSSLNDASPAKAGTPFKTNIKDVGETETHDRRGSDSSAYSDAKETKQNDEKDQDKGFIFFILIANWFHGLWNWLVGTKRQAEGTHMEDRE